MFDLPLMTFFYFVVASNRAGLAFSSVSLQHPRRTKLRTAATKPDVCSYVPFANIIAKNRVQLPSPALSQPSYTLPKRPRMEKPSITPEILQALSF